MKKTTLSLAISLALWGGMQTVNAALLPTEEPTTPIEINNPQPPMGEGQQPPMGEGQQPPMGEGQQPPMGEGQQLPTDKGDGHRPRLEHFGIDPRNINDLTQLNPEEMQAFRPSDVKQLPPQAFNQLTPEQVQQLPPDALEGMVPEQFEQMPPQALTGLNAQNMGHLPPRVINKFQSKHLQNLDKTQFQNMPGNGVAKFLANFDPQQVQPTEVQGFLPPGWEMQQNGSIKPPVGAKLALPPKIKQPQSPNMQFPEMPDFNKGIGLGGTSNEGQTTLDGLNATLQQSGFPGFQFQQQDDGILSIDSSDGSDPLSLAFMADNTQMVQEDEQMPSGISQNERGQFVITTLQKQSIPMIPAPKNPQELADMLPPEGEVKMGEQGDMLLKLLKQGRPAVSGICDPFVLPAPNGKQPGIHFEQTPDGEESAQIVYEDGTMQTMRPTVPSPEKLIAKGQEISGVEKMTHRMDGRIEVIFMGQRFFLVPRFDVQIKPADRETTEPELSANEDGSLNYRLPTDDEEVIETQLLLMPAEE